MLESNVLLKETGAQNMNPEALRKFAEEKSAEILLNIEESLKSIADFQATTPTQVDLSGVESVKNFFTLGNTKRDKDLSELKKDFENSHEATGQIMYRLIMLIQESVKFTCTSVDLAQCMQSAMAVMMAKGFKDRDGNFHELDHNTQEFALYIMSQAESFVENQAEYESRVGKIEGDISDLKIIEDDQDIKIENNSINLEKQANILTETSRKSDEHDIRIAKVEVHEAEQDAVLEIQLNKDIEHDNRLDAGDLKDVEHDKRLDEGDEKDRIQDEQIAKQAELDKELFAIVDQLIKSNQENESKINELQIKIDELTSCMNSNSSNHVEKEKQILSDLEGKASKKATVIAYGIGIVGLLVAVIQFFI